MIQLRFTLCIGSSICSLLRIYIRPLLLRMFLESRQPPMGKVIIWPRICLRNYMYLSRLNYLEFVLSFSMWFWDHWAFLVVQIGKESAWNMGDLGSVPGSGRSPGEGNGCPFQYSCLENSMDREALQATVHGVAKSHMTERWDHCFKTFRL